MQKSACEHLTAFEGGLMLQEEGDQDSSWIPPTQERRGMDSFRKEEG